MDIVTYALCKKIAAGAVSGISGIELNGTTLTMTTNDGTKYDMEFPVPADGISVSSVDIDDDGSLLCYLSDGSVVDAGTVPSVKGDPGYTPVKGVDYFTEEDIEEIVDQLSNYSVSELPVYDAETGRLYACGTAITVEKSETEGMLDVEYLSENGYEIMTIPENPVIFGGGNGIDGSVNYLNSDITINSGHINDIYGGSYGDGNVGVASIVINGGTFEQGVNGGGRSYINAEEKVNFNSSVGSVNIIVNNTDGEIPILYGGSGTGYGTTGQVRIAVNGGSIKYLVGGGSNGTTSNSEVVVNDGKIYCYQSCNRGAINNAKITIKGGELEKVYAGGAPGKEGATYKKSEIYILAGMVNFVGAGHNGGVAELGNVKGKFYTDCVADREQALAIGLIEIAPYATKEDIDKLFDGEIFDLYATKEDIDALFDEEE